MSIDPRERLYERTDCFYCTNPLDPVGGRAAIVKSAGGRMRRVFHSGCLMALRLAGVRPFDDRVYRVVRVTRLRG